jgi:hypothetical protein
MFYFISYDTLVFFIPNFFYSNEEGSGFLGLHWPAHGSFIPPRAAWFEKCGKKSQGLGLPPQPQL